jgi:thiol-disulfide isomerase/thioredoxin
MLLIVLLSLRLDLTLDNHQLMINMSRTIPTFGVFYSRSCGHCESIPDMMANLSAKYEKDPRVVIVSCDCFQNRDACNATFSNTAFPTFFVSFGGIMEQIRMERTLDAFTAQVENLRRLDPHIRCRRYFHQLTDLPVIGISFPDPDPIACQKILELEQQAPESAGRLRLAPSTGHFSLTVVVSRRAVTEYTGPTDMTSVASYIRDHIHLSLTKWPLNESNLITTRRFAFLVYNSTIQIARAEHFAVLQTDNFCFGLMPVDEFRLRFTEVVLLDSELPAIAVVNREQTLFKLVKSVQFHAELGPKFEAMVNETEDPEMVIPYRYDSDVVWREAGGGNGVDDNL